MDSWLTPHAGLRHCMVPWLTHTPTHTTHTHTGCFRLMLIQTGSRYVFVLVLCWHAQIQNNSVTRPCPCAQGLISKVWWRSVLHLLDMCVCICIYIYVCIHTGCFRLMRSQTGSRYVFVLVLCWHAQMQNNSVTRPWPSVQGLISKVWWRSVLHLLDMCVCICNILGKVCLK